MKPEERKGDLHSTEVYRKMDILGRSEPEEGRSEPEQKSARDVARGFLLHDEEGTRQPIQETLRSRRNRATAGILLLPSLFLA